MERRKMMLTKNDMARVVVQALFLTKELPTRDNIHVKRIERKRKDILADDHKLAMKILNDKIMDGYFD